MLGVGCWVLLVQTCSSRRRYMSRSESARVRVVHMIGVRFGARGSVVGMHQQLVVAGPAIEFEEFSREISP